ncbi:TlpA disulfide reductase family protein [Neolewinella lacunae]|uniref:TlpA family protein disulfide reductase n=1 Tax=Neolewinella lacunae TaxID=1517758 RepID=A0A923PIN8_9BACT|nr:TlpA disulfide reductase family protein [Neolewinella lacunae]MBC6994853.1 TlpA family protein disulfide reductase [Neolewinella lacunae]MDN3636773.1 TlpA disulfide reductase family protein [Neolewinella lacunae]
MPLLLLGAYFLGKTWYLSPSQDAEAPAAEFTAVRADGLSFSLSDLRGGYVLLDFWGSWCGPCRRESPALRQLNASTAGQLTIVSIAIEQDSSAWKRARTQDARDWPFQVMDYTPSFRFLDGNVAARYGVRQVPTNFLIDPNGTVIGVNVPLSAIAGRITGQSNSE